MSLYERRALVASPTAPARAAAAELADTADWVDPGDADVIIALGGDGFLLQTLHGLLDRRRPRLRSYVRNRVLRVVPAFYLFTVLVLRDPDPPGSTTPAADPATPPATESVSPG